jgi:hypothetical protein
MQGLMKHAQGLDVQGPAGSTRYILVCHQVQPAGCRPTAATTAVAGGGSSKQHPLSHMRCCCYRPRAIAQCLEARHEGLDASSTSTAEAGTASQPLRQLAADGSLLPAGQQQPSQHLLKPLQERQPHAHGSKFGHTMHDSSAVVHWPSSVPRL